MTKVHRLREIDFLRGWAIILVLLRHKYLFQFTYLMGWTGVDLFFVLSGFLVSGLLFREYQKYGNIEAKRFLIRRGFKIYPIYYLTYPLYIILLLSDQKLSVRGLVGDLTFTQNYVSGWGYAYVPSWSLAIEEHFYFLLTFVLWWLLRRKGSNEPTATADNKLKYLPVAIVSIMVLCLAGRIIENVIVPGKLGRNWTMTHLRIDSLSAGVLISYFYHFHLATLKAFVRSNRWLLLIICILGLSWTAFIDPIPSVFAKTLGFSLLYISFGILLIFFLLINNINSYLDKLFTRPVVNFISKIGYCSYSIYIIHSLVNSLFDNVSTTYGLGLPYYIAFFLTSALSIGIGMIMTYTVENYFLRIRDRYFPRRVKLGV